MSELKRCPFCLSDDVGIAEYAAPFGYGVVCNKCEANGPFAVTKREALRRWNFAARRSDDIHIGISIDNVADHVRDIVAEHLRQAILEDIAKEIE